MTKIEVYGADGLRQLSRDLSAIDKGLGKELQKVNRAAAETVAEEAERNYERLHPSKSGRGAKSIRSLASQTRAQVAFGSAKAPYIGGQEFGSKGGKGKKQFPAYNRGGYAIYPAIGEEMKELPAKHRAAIDELMKETGFDG